MYININTLAQATESEIRAANPNTSFPVPFVAPEEYAYVFPTPSNHSATQIAVEALPELTTLGHWEQRWTVTDKSVETLEAEALVAAQAFQTAVVTATQLRLDAFAKTRNYDGILSACTYATSGIPNFASDGQYAINARDLSWATLYTLMGEVQAGTRSMPGTVEEIIALLPELVWPV